jgi:hypothetical protein
MTHSFCVIIHDYTDLDHIEESLFSDPYFDEVFASAFVSRGNMTLGFAKEDDKLSFSEVVKETEQLLAKYIPDYKLLAVNIFEDNIDD